MSEQTTNLPEIIIDEEFQRLLPPLDEQEFCRLEENILTYGCMNPLVLWNGILIDGHNRYNIVTKHNLPFNTISLKFNSRDEAIAWMIRVQIDRRNLTPMQLTYYRGMHYNIEKKIHGDIGRVSQNSASGHNDHLQGSTANRLSSQYKISPRTIRRDGEISDVIIAIGKESEDAKRDILSGAVKINRRQLREIASDSDADIVSIASKIEEGTFEEDSSAAKHGSPEAGNQNGSNTENHRVEASVISGANKFIANIRGLPQNAGPKILKTTIRSYINSLEELYSRI